jgi:hypothetical protein
MEHAQNADVIDSTVIVNYHSARLRSPPLPLCRPQRPYPRAPAASSESGSASIASASASRPSRVPVRMARRVHSPSVLGPSSRRQVQLARHYRRSSRVSARLATRADRRRTLFFGFFEFWRREGERRTLRRRPVLSASMVKNSSVEENVGRS